MDEYSARAAYQRSLEMLEEDEQFWDEDLERDMKKEQNNEHIRADTPGTQNR